MSNDAPVQHTPKHLTDGEVFDQRHPAASSFAPLQPAAGVVADDVEERGQNLRGGPTASQAQRTHANQREELARQHAETLRATAGGSDGPSATVEGGEARPAESADAKSTSGEGKSGSRSAKGK